MSAGLLYFLNKDNVNIVTITSSTSYNKPANLNKVLVILTGAGAKGGDTDVTSSSSVTCAGGGGAGGTIVKLFDQSELGASETVTIGTNGGNSTFGGLLTANGGTAGTNVTEDGLSSGGDGGSPTGGDINIKGGAGFPGIRTQSTGNPAGIGGKGGESFWGGAGRQLLLTAGNGSNGSNGNAPGSGGGGAANANNGTDRTGGDGAPGICIIIEYLNP